MSIKMRALKLMGMVLLTMMMCVTFASCGDDENGATTSAIEGTISISGNQATYKYTWHDYAGEWDSDTEYTMTLIKQ